LITDLSTCCFSQFLGIFHHLTTLTSQSSTTQNVPTFMAISLPIPRSVLVLLTARALAMWVFHLDILQKFTSSCSQHKTCCHQPDRLYSNKFSRFYINCANSITIHCKHRTKICLQCSMIFFSSIFLLNFLSSMWQN